MSSCIIIPARLGSTRLENKVLAEINGKPMILRVFENCKKAEVGDVFVSTDSLEVKAVIERVGGNTILTPSELPSGTDRIFHALKEIEGMGKFYDKIINVQGDVPNISPLVIRQTAELMEIEKKADITTPVTKIKTEARAEKPNVVKAVLSFKSQDHAKALYFTRTKTPYGEGDFYEHIGLYVYTRSSLEKFVNLKPSPLELREKLEQLRALEAGFNIFCKIVEFEAISVDVAEDLEHARKVLI